MNILGIGTDIVEIKRVKKIYNKYGDNFARKILSNDEFKKYKLFCLGKMAQGGAKFLNFPISVGSTFFIFLVIFWCLFFSK